MPGNEGPTGIPGPRGPKGQPVSYPLLDMQGKNVLLMHGRLRMGQMGRKAKKVVLVLQERKERRYSKRVFY